MNKFFERVTTDPDYAKYNITVHSRPRRPDEDESVKDGPWLITFDNFISNEEADRLIELGGVEGYKRSTDVGAIKPDGSYTGKASDLLFILFHSNTSRLISLLSQLLLEDVHSTRTSENSWCMEKCMADPIAQNVVNRIEQVTQIPQTNSESLQLLRYGEGQYYGVHHDLITEQTNRPPGVRILTFYMYLNGNEESGLEGECVQCLLFKKSRMVLLTSSFFHRLRWWHFLPTRRHHCHTKEGMFECSLLPAYFITI